MNIFIMFQLKVSIKYWTSVDFEYEIESKIASFTLWKFDEMKIFMRKSQVSLLSTFNSNKLRVSISRLYREMRKYDEMQNLFSIKRLKNIEPTRFSSWIFASNVSSVWASQIDDFMAELFGICTFLDKIKILKVACFYAEQHRQFETWKL